MTSRGPLQPQPFCDSVLGILATVRLLSIPLGAARSAQSPPVLPYFHFFDHFSLVLPQKSYGFPWMSLSTFSFSIMLVLVLELTN